MAQGEAQREVDGWRGEQGLAVAGVERVRAKSSDQLYAYGAFSHKCISPKMWAQIAL